MYSRSPGNAPAVTAQHPTRRFKTHRCSDPVCISGSILFCRCSQMILRIIESPFKGTFLIKNARTLHLTCLPSTTCPFYSEPFLLWNSRANSSLSVAVRWQQQSPHFFSARPILPAMISFPLGLRCPESAKTLKNLEALA